MLDFVELENGKEYAIVYALESNNNKYLVLANEDDEFDLNIRKVIVKDGKEYLTKLDSDREFDNVMHSFLNKYRKGSVNEE